MFRSRRKTSRRSGCSALRAGGLAAAITVGVWTGPASAAGSIAPLELLPVELSRSSEKAALGQTITKTTTKVTPSTKIAGDPRRGYGPEQRAQELYLDGLEKLEAGRQLWARRTFETLVARYPETNAAGMARSKLGELYRPAAAPVATPGPANPPAPAPRAELVMTASDSLKDLPNWEIERRHHSALQARLRTGAGDRIFFSQGSSDLGGRARTALSAQARWLKENGDIEVAIEGHADEPGSADDNVVLSEQRAMAVRDRLIEEGVSQERIVVLPRGRSDRLATCGQPECQAQNRRAVTVVMARGTIVRLRQIAQQEHVKSIQPQAQALGLPQSRGRPATSSWQGAR